MQILSLMCRQRSALPLTVSLLKPEPSMTAGQTQVGNMASMSDRRCHARHNSLRRPVNLRVAASRQQFNYDTYGDGSGWKVLQMMRSLAYHQEAGCSWEERTLAKSNPGSPANAECKAVALVE